MGRSVSATNGMTSKRKRGQGRDPHKRKLRDDHANATRAIASRELREKFESAIPNDGTPLSRTSPVDDMTADDAVRLIDRLDKIRKKVAADGHASLCITPANKPNAPKSAPLTRSHRFYNAKTSNRTEAETWWNQSNASQKALVETEIKDDTNN